MTHRVIITYFIIVDEESFTHPVSSGGDKAEVRNNLSSEFKGANLILFTIFL